MLQIPTVNVHDHKSLEAMTNKFADLMDLSESRKHLDRFFGKFACHTSPPADRQVTGAGDQRAVDRRALAQAHAGAGAPASAECCSDFSCATALRSPPSTASPTHCQEDGARQCEEVSASAASDLQQDDVAKPCRAVVAPKHQLVSRRDGPGGAQKARRLLCTQEGSSRCTSGDAVPSSVPTDVCDLCGEASQCRCEVLFDEEDVCDKFDVSDDEDGLDEAAVVGVEGGAAWI